MSGRSSAQSERLRGSYDMLNDKERWQLLSKELAQKQELIHQVVSQTMDQNKLAGQKVAEIKQLQSAVQTIREQAT